MLHLKAPAKLNLHLRVFPKDETNLHLIESIFHPIALYDDIFISIIDGSNECRVLCSQMDLPAENTISKAYSLFCKETTVSQSVQVKVVKNIPVGAGLGGGSSDGATVLMALNSFFETSLSQIKLLEIAAQIGCDVPFFLCKKSALVEGYGEKIMPLETLDNLYFVIIYPNVMSSTVEAYRLLDNWTARHTDQLQWLSAKDLPSFYAGGAKKWLFENSFTQPLVERYPIIGKAINDIKNAGAIYSNLTGSGSAVFGVFESADKANVAHTKLSSQWENCLLTKSANFR
ncbi:MAG: 4-(cytidine 5'-diphospho)-2-C-methyl-D-erythritol kinase [Treponemataceae bacterium]